RAASDRVQAAYDDGSLFETVLPNLALTLPPPVLLTPAEDAVITVGDVYDAELPPLEWEPVPGATFYSVQIATVPDFSDRRTYFVEEPALHGYGFPANDIRKVFWRVRAEEEGVGVSPWSETRRFVYYRHLFDFFGGGTGVVETAHPDVDDVCAWGGKEDVGCQTYGGNAVYADPNSTGDYALVSTSVFRHMIEERIIEDEDFELRFTEACATPGTCLGAYVRDGALITSVPFELWNIGDEDDPSDDVRMITLVRPSGSGRVEDWADTFTA